MKLVRALTGLSVGVALLLVACSSAPPPTIQPSGPVSQSSAPVTQSAAPASQTPAASDGQATRTSEGGQVTASATWAGPAAGAVFDVTLDTHSVDLDALDLADAVLRNDRGQALIARPWSAPAGGHHRAGTLSFDGDSASFFASARWIELFLPGIGDLPERILRWEIAA